MKSILPITYLAAACLNAAAETPQFACCTTAHSTGRPDAHAPISIMGDHTHSSDSWMLSYRFMRMNMDGMRHGTDDVSSQDVFDAGYTVTPERMTMDMHMLGFMYAASDELTFMLMANYADIEMDHRINPAAGMLVLANSGNGQFTTRSNGLADTKLTALYKFYEDGNRKAHFGLGLSLPTGSIDEKDQLPMMGMGLVNSPLPAPMQLGSGTFDLLPSLTFRQQFNDWSYGLQAKGNIRLEDENDRNYRLGHNFDLSGWAGYVLTDWISLGGGLNYQWNGELKGAQEGINQGPMMGRNTVTTAYGSNYGGERVDAIFGLNLLAPSGKLLGHRLAADIRLPLWQDLKGYQLETDWVLTLGWQKAW